MAPCGEPIRLFVTVGSQLPFDRMVATVASWIRTKTSVQAFAQIGLSKLHAKALEPLRIAEQLTPSHYAYCVHEADLIVAHAGMGSILTALEANRPLVIVPRRGHLLETRNDHQFDTAMQILRQQASGAGGMVRAALDEAALPSVLDQSIRDVVEGGFKGNTQAARTPSASHTALIHALRHVILN